VLVQSYNPQAPPVARMLAGDYLGFCEAELKRRADLAWPPYSRLAAIRIEATDEHLARRVAQSLARVLARALPPASHGVRLLGPAPAPITRIKGKSRWQLVLKGPTHAALGPPLDALEHALEDVPSAVRVVIDVDPVAML
jgi:primosomal protein N' (replication factor Y)